MTELEKLVNHMRQKLGDLGAASLGAEYNYSALPLCVIDAVFSLGVRYEQTKRAVQAFCDRCSWDLSKTPGTVERTVAEFLEILRPYENRWEEAAREIFRNRQRTSSQSGILKAEAVFRFAEKLHKFGINTFADALAPDPQNRLREDIAKIPGQKSGLSYNYFLILAGNPEGVKADRMVSRFVADALAVPEVPAEECERLVREAAASLQAEFPNLTPRLLDNVIWNYQRQHPDNPKLHRKAAAG